MNPHQTHPHDGRPHMVTIDRQEPEQPARVDAEDEDVRRVPTDWKQVVELVEGVKRQGYTDTQKEYFVAAMGLCWAKAFRAGQAAKENA